MNILSKIIFVLFLISNQFCYADEFPNKPIRIIVGSGADQIARILSEQLSITWAQPVIVELRLTAGGMVAGDTVAKSLPDGSTILMSSSAYPALQALQPKMQFNFFKDLQPVLLFTKSTFVIVMSNQVPVNSFVEFIQQAQKPGIQLNYASVGQGTSSHIAGEMLNQEANIHLTHVPYKNYPAVISDLLAGQVQISFAPLTSVQSLIKDGKLKAIAVTTESRDSNIPNVPTLVELGFPNMNFSGWNGFHVPINTPQSTVQRIYQDVAKITSTQEFKTKAAQAGYQLVLLNSKEFAEFQLKDFNRMSKVINQAQIKIN
ncbi:MAG: tripartite tricarboxylate transporter substrate binding protein [Betaproteobacteria bacterium]|jgi:tripartite-type tricarboxylate transporter receptor subunit TctC